MRRIQLLPQVKRWEYRIRHWRKILCWCCLAAVILLAVSFWCLTQRLFTIRQACLESEAEYRLVAHYERRLAEIHSERQKLLQTAEELAKLSSQRISVYAQLIYIGIHDFSKVNLAQIQYAFADRTIELSGTADELEAVNELVHYLEKEKIWQGAVLAKLERLENGKFHFLIRLTIAEP